MARAAHLPLWAAPGVRSVGLRNKRRRQNAEADGQYSAVKMSLCGLRRRHKGRLI